MKRYSIPKIFFFPVKYGRIRWMKENGYMKHRNKIFDLRKRKRLWRLDGISLGTVEK